MPDPTIHVTQPGGPAMRRHAARFGLTIAASAAGAAMW